MDECPGGEEAYVRRRGGCTVRQKTEFKISEQAFGEAENRGGIKLTNSVRVGIVSISLSKGQERGGERGQES